MKGGSKWTTGWRTSLANSHTMRTTAERPWLRREGHSLSKTALHVDQKSRWFQRTTKPQLCQLRISVLFYPVSLASLKCLRMVSWILELFSYGIMSPQKWKSMVLCPDIFEDHWDRVKKLTGHGKTAFDAANRTYEKVSIYGLLCPIRRSRSWSYFVSLASYGLCWFASCCVPRHIRAFAYEVNNLPEPSSQSSFKPRSNPKSRLLTELEDRLLSILSSEP